MLSSIKVPTAKRNSRRSGGRSLIRGSHHSTVCTYPVSCLGAHLESVDLQRASKTVPGSKSPHELGLRPAACCAEGAARALQVQVMDAQESRVPLNMNLLAITNHNKPPAPTPQPSNFKPHSRAGGRAARLPGQLARPRTLLLIPRKSPQTADSVLSL